MNHFSQFVVLRVVQPKMLDPVRATVTWGEPRAYQIELTARMEPGGIGHHVHDLIVMLNPSAALRLYRRLGKVLNIKQPKAKRK